MSYLKANISVSTTQVNRTEFATPTSPTLQLPLSNLTLSLPLQLTSSLTLSYFLTIFCFITWTLWFGLVH